jgi:hypothetical protein
MFCSGRRRGSPKQRRGIRSRDGRAQGLAPCRERTRAPVASVDPARPTLVQGPRTPCSAAWGPRSLTCAHSWAHSYRIRELSREGVHTWTEGRASAIRAVERGLDTPGGRGLRSSFRHAARQRRGGVRRDGPGHDPAGGVGYARLPPTVRALLTPVNATRREFSPASQVEQLGDLRHCGAVRDEVGPVAAPHSGRGRLTNHQVVAQDALDTDDMLKSATRQAGIDVRVK